MKISITELFNRLDTEEKQELAKLLTQEQSILSFDTPEDALDYVIEHFYPEEILKKISIGAVVEFAKDIDETPLILRM